MEFPPVNLQLIYCVVLYVRHYYRGIGSSVYARRHIELLYYTHPRVSTFFYYGLINFVIFMATCFFCELLYLEY